MNPRKSEWRRSTASHAMREASADHSYIAKKSQRVDIAGAVNETLPLRVATGRTAQLGVPAMTSLFGHSIRSELLLLYVVEALACFLAGYLLLSWGIAPNVAGQGGGGIAFALRLALSSGLVSGASGLYQPESWLRVRRLLGNTAVAGLLLLILTWPLLYLFGIASAEGRLAHLA